MLWFDPSGKKQKFFGLHFYNVNKDLPPKTTINENSDNASDKDKNGSAPQNETRRQDETMDLNIELIYNNKLIRDDSIIKGVEAVLKRYDGNFIVCEIKIPLKSNDEIKYAINPAKKYLNYLIEASYFTMNANSNNRSGMNGGMGQRGPGPGGQGTPPNGSMGDGPPMVKKGSGNQQPPDSRMQNGRKMIQQIKIEGIIQLAKE